MNKCISLFGTCGKSNWREDFIKDYKKLEINYFNPVKENWDAEIDGANEVEHSNNDTVLVFVITDEEPSYISLMEIGYKIANLDYYQSLCVFIDPNCSDKRSKEMRTLALKYLENFTEFMCSSIEECFRESVKAYYK